MLSSRGARCVTARGLAAEAAVQLPATSRTRSTHEDIDVSFDPHEPTRSNSKGRGEVVAERVGQVVDDVKSRDPLKWKALACMGAFVYAKRVLGQARAT